MLAHPVGLEPTTSPSQAVTYPLSAHTKVMYGQGNVVPLYIAKGKAPASAHTQLQGRESNPSKVAYETTDQPLIHPAQVRRFLLGMLSRPGGRTSNPRIAF